MKERLGDDDRAGRREHKLWLMTEQGDDSTNWLMTEQGDDSTNLG